MEVYYRKLQEKLNELLELRRKEKQHYQEKEALIADTYTKKMLLLMKILK